MEGRIGCYGRVSGLFDVAAVPRGGTCRTRQVCDIWGERLLVPFQLIGGMNYLVLLSTLRGDMAEGKQPQIVGTALGSSRPGAE